MGGGGDHSNSCSPGNATSTTAYGPIYNPAAPPPSTENYLAFGGGGGGLDSQAALRLAGSGKWTALLARVSWSSF